jgi:DNA-3-methyladenine glycosylase II
MVSREINGKRLAQALAHLAEADADLARAIELVGAPPSRARPPGFGTLLQIIVGQQLSTASAEAIWRRLVAAIEPLTPEGFLALDDEGLRAIGFSRAKVLYGRGLAQMVAEGRLDLEALAQQPDEAVIKALGEIRGFGRWSAEVYLLFCLARPDVLPADDLALLVAAQRVKGLAERPTPKQFRALAEPWRPWRSVAARLLWHYYRRAPLGEAANVPRASA